MKFPRFLFFSFLLLSAVLANSQIIINEIMATNVTINYETDYYNFPDWTELYNSGTMDINLAEYYISDDASELQKWKLPSAILAPNMYYIIYCDKKSSGMHTNFGLNTGGETIYLSNASGNIIDQIEYPEQYPDVSYGRNPSDLNNWFYCATPTPGDQNMTTNATEVAPKVGFSVAGGRLNTPVSLSLTGPEIKYTTNGAVPTISSSSYSQEININKTMVVKTKSFQEGFIPGETAANTYFLEEHHFTLPVVSLSFNPEYFYDEMIGIHVVGKNGTSGLCGSVANWYQPWERAAYLEYFDVNGKRQISQPVGLKLAGGCTRGRDQKSISVYARSKYGDSDFDYAFFKQKPDMVRFKSVLLRNSGNDQDQTLLRDAFIQALVNNSVDLDYQSYQPCIVYFNGQYRGIMNLREKVDEDYFFSNYTLGSNEIDFLEGILFSEAPPNYVALRGTDSEYLQLVNYLTDNNLSGALNFQYIANQLDLQEYINYMALQIYIGNRDWPGNNLKFWKKKENGKWRWIVFDLDYGFGFRLDPGEDYLFESFHHATQADGLSHPNPAWSTLLFRKLLENERFKKQFLSTFNALMYSSFKPEWCDYVLDSLSSVIDFEIYYNNQKYGRTKSQWIEYLNTIKSYAVNRYHFMPGYTESFFELSPENKVTASITNQHVEKGKAEVNKVTVHQYPFSMITYKEIPLRIKAIPAYGYRFSQWNQSGTDIKYSEDQEIISETSFNLNIEPVFEPIDKLEGIFLNEIAPVSALFRDEFNEESGFVELFNNTAKEAILYSCFISDKKDNLQRYAIPDSTIIPAGGFITFYLDAEARQGSLHASFKADKDGEVMILSQKVGDTIHILDSVSFSLLVEDHSFGKYTDGTGNWQHMVIMTPGFPNDASRLNNTRFIPEITYNITIYPNPSDGNITVCMDESIIYEHTFTMDIIDVTGKVVYPKVWLNSNNNRIYLSALNQGLYFSRVFKNNQLIYTGKIIISK